MSHYYTLVAALPALPMTLKQEPLPISRIALNQRLTMLSADDQVQLALAERLYFDYSLRETLANQIDQDLARQWQNDLLKIDSPILRERIERKFELRTLLAALRYRQQAELSGEHFCGVGRWTQQIRRHWHEPLFGLEARLPWLTDYAALLQQDLSLQLEHQWRQLQWRDLLYHERLQPFSLEAVVCFVLRWHLVEQSLQEDTQQALQQFQQLTDELLARPALLPYVEQVFEEMSS